MTVQELRDELDNFDDDAEVCVRIMANNGQLLQASLLDQELVVDDKVIFHTDSVEVVDD